MSAEPLTDVGEVRTVYSADMRPLEQASQRAPQIVEQAAQRINQVLAQPAAGFDNLAAAASRSATAASASLASTSGAAQQAAQSFSVVGSSAQQAASQVQGASSQAATSLGQINPAAQQAAAAIPAIGSTAQTTGQQVAGASAQAASALNTVTPAAQSAASGMQAFAGGSQTAQSASAALQAQVGSNIAQMNALSVQIAQNRVELANLAQQINASKDAEGKATAQTAALKTQYQQLASETRVLAAQKSLLGAQTNALTGATNTSAAAQVAVTQTMNQQNAVMRILSGLMTTNTTQISSQGTVWQGYDATVQAVARSLGGLPVAYALVITLVGTMADKLLNLASAQKKQIELNNDAVDTHISLAEGYRRVAEGTDAAASAAARQAIAYETITKGDFQAAILSFEQSYLKLESATMAAEKATLSFNQINELRNRLLADGIDITRLSIEDANQLAAQQGGVYNEVRNVVAALGQQQAALLLSAEAQQKQEQETAKAVATIIGYKQQMGLSAEATLQLVQSITTNINVIARLKTELDGVTDAANRYRAAIASAKLAQFDTLATTADLARANEQLANSIQGSQSVLSNTVGAQNAYKESLLASIPAARQVARAEIDRIVASARLEGTIKTKSQAEKEYINTLRNSAVASDRAKLLALQLDEANRKTAGGARAARTALNEYSASAMDVGRAIDLLISKAQSGQLEKLFEPIGKKGAAEVRELQNALKAVTPAVNEFLQATGSGVKVTEAQLAKLIQTNQQNVVSVLQQSEAYRQLKESLTLVSFARLAQELPPLDTNFKIVGRTIEINITTLRELAKTYPEVIANIKALGLVIKEVFPAMKLIIADTSQIAKEKFDVITSAVEAFGIKTKRAFKETADAAPHWAGSIVDACEAIQVGLENSATAAIARAQVETQQSIDSMISDFERLADNLNLTGEEWRRFVEQHVRKALEETKALNEEAIDEIVERWRRGLTRLPGIWEEIFKDVSATTREQVNDILTIIDALPGEIGDTLRKVESEFRRWFTILDAVVKITQRAMGKEPTGIVGIIQDAISSIADIFRSKKTDIEAVLDDVFGPVANKATQAGGASGEGFAKGFLGKMGLITAGLATFLGTRGQGRLTGVLGGALAGAQIGSAIAPGIGTAIGAGIGAIAGLFGAGKSELQKLQEEAAKQQARDAIELSKQQLEQAKQATQQAIIQTGKELAELIKEAAVSVHVPKEVLQQFVKNISTLLKLLAKSLMDVANESADEMKRAAEAIKPLIEVAAAAPTAIHEINKGIPLAESSLATFEDNWTRLLATLDRIFTETEKSERKHARKLAKQSEGIPEFVTGLAESIAAVNQVPAVDTAGVERLGEATRLILEELGVIFAELDRFQLRRTGADAAVALPILEFTQALSDVLRAAVNQEVPGPADWERLGNAARASFDFVFTLFEQIAVENVARAAHLSETASPIASFISALFGTLKAGGEAGTLPEIDFNALKQRALEMIRIAVEIASEVNAEAVRAGSQISEDASKIPSFIGAIAGAIKASAEVGDAQANIAQLKAQGLALIHAVIDMAAEFEQADVEAGAQLSESGIAIAGFAKDLGDALKSLAEGSTVGAVAVTLALTTFRLIVEGMASLRTQISSEALRDATAIASDAAQLFGHINTASSAMRAVSEIKVAETFAFIANTRNFINAMQVVRDDVHRGRSLAAEILDDAQAIHRDMFAAASLLSEVATASMRAVSTPAATTITTPAASVMTPGGPTLTAIRTPQPVQETTVVQVTVQGSLIHESQLEDVVISAVQKAGRRGRVQVRMS